ncbi:Stp1/IreP family PP2C-type Ser/Thr phosphatase [Nocardiopsis sp. HNM0947]|uniref:Stp1/IreP family PP2C-type Ser/Thr phosphatase n=1 Tax=Nocardiopsis coralli TaxID=2772213 RepID=A0ABR9PD91_9ACTN|nr:Stp1/IreP family PP2C-type Ser/Thr phosphatase [Nocardiopsis coralli]MBE3001799.1 Stp1/IreP family PP2C-type Ser/Thr phosphatase [Nocardiopsis coralli]
MTIALRYAAYSDVGCLREGNEDSGYAGQHLLAVADGMGGYAGGEVASSIAISTIRRLDTENPRSDEMVEVLQNAVVQANASLSQRIMEEPQLENMGTTLTAMLWAEGRVALLHIGDSRAYLLRGQVFKQITHDHTLVQTLVDEGKITEEEVATHPQRSLILRALDGKSPVDPDVSINEAEVGDRYLLCSDGLSGVVSQKTIRETLEAESDPHAVARKLIDLAIRGGGPDNITAVVADVVESEADPAGPSQVVGAAGQRREGVDEGSDTPARRARDLRENGGDTAEMDPVEDENRDYGEPYGDPYGEGRGNGQETEYRRRRWWPMVLVFLAVVALVAGVGYYFGNQYVQDQYFVGPSSDGETVSVYQGIDTNIAGIDLSDEIESSDIRIDALSTSDRDAVNGTVPFESEQEAVEHLDTLREGIAENQNAGAADNAPEADTGADTGAETGTDGGTTLGGADEGAEETG